MSTGTGVRVSARVSGFTYAIRNIVAEAQKVEAAGPTGPLPQHRRSDSVRLPHAAASGRSGRRGDARRAQRLYAVGRHRSRRGRRSPASTSRAACRSPPTAWCSRPARPKASSSRSARSPTRATKCSCRRRPIRSTRPCSRRSARARCTTAPIPIAAGCRISTTFEALITPRRARSSSSIRTIRQARCIRRRHGAR